MQFTKPPLALSLKLDIFSFVRMEIFCWLLGLDLKDKITICFDNQGEDFSIYGSQSYMQLNLVDNKELWENVSKI